ncbi:MAG: GlxA family transcriptional regulator [Gammaproteobacteria bacterium]|nr:GlxA family transcriptional regulator [Gammaproteobacteria bacterium]MDE0366227.1 GlxA family transcriptional regulator [Gammaproteobacteria bacterium]
MPEGRPYRYGFLLTPDFTLIAFSSAVEVLRMANLTSQQELYRWSVLSLDDRPVASSASFEIQPNLPFAHARELDALFVCAGVNVRKNWDARLGTELRRLAAANMPLGALCTASYLLAKAGVLDDYRCTVHWEYIASMREEFPRLTVKDDIFEIDRKRYTCAGGTAPLDLMLYLVSRDYGRDVAFDISEEFTVERIRDLGETQEVSVRNQSPGAPDYLSDAVQLMKHNVSERLFVEEIAEYLKVSTRQLERAFKRYFNTSPSQYYLRVRLNAARNLLRHSSMTVRAIAIETGFKSLQHFSKCYFDHFKVRPTQERGR